MLSLDPVPAPASLRELSDEELAREAQRLHRDRTRADAGENRLLAEVERRRALAPSVWRDSAGWLQHETGVARSTARAHAEVAVRLTETPVLADALDRLEIGFDHARVISDHLGTENRPQLVADQAHVLGLARGSPAEAFRKAMDAWAGDLNDQREGASRTTSGR